MQCGCSIETPKRLMTLGPFVRYHVMQAGQLTLFGRSSHSSVSPTLRPPFSIILISLPILALPSIPSYLLSR